jgi:predicted DNA-binding protein (UPF0251 family)
MPRQRRCRWVGFQPNFFYFEPRGSANPEVVVLKVEELESIRLKDYLKMEQEEAAERMGHIVENVSAFVEGKIYIYI